MAKTLNDVVTRIKKALQKDAPPARYPKQTQVYKPNPITYNAAKYAGKAQEFIESGKPTKLLPTAKIKFNDNAKFTNPVKNPKQFVKAGVDLEKDVNKIAYNIGAEALNTIVGRGVIDPALDLGANIVRSAQGKDVKDYRNVKSPATKIGYQVEGLIGKKGTKQALNIDTRVQEGLANLAAAIEPILYVSGGGKAAGAAQTGVKATGKTALKKAMIEGFKKGAISGGEFGVVEGLQAGRNDELKDQLIKSVWRGVIGAGIGGAVGAAIPAAGAGISKVSKMVKANGGGERGSIDYSAPVGKDTAKEQLDYANRELAKLGGGKQGKTIETLLEEKSGWKPGMREKFDDALYRKDADTIRALLPDVPPSYRARFQDNIDDILTPKESGLGGIINTVEKTLKDQSGYIRMGAEVGKRESKDKVDDALYQADDIAAKALERGGSKSLDKVDDVVLSKTDDALEQTDDVIRKSSVGKPVDGTDFVEISRNKFDKIYTEGVDKYHPLSLLGKAANKDQKMRNALTQHYGAGSTSEYHVEFGLKPILKGKDVNDVRSYLIAQRDLELAGRGIKGSTNRANAAKTIADLQTKYGNDFPALEQTAQQIYQYQDDLVKKYLVDTGVISQKGYESMLAKNQKYVPFKRVMDTVDDQLGISTKKGTGSVGSQNVIKSIKGSDREVVDPLESIVENTYKIVSLGRRNEVARTIVSMQDDLPPGIIVPYKGDIGNKPVISVMVDGKQQKYLVPVDVAEAAKGLNQDSINTFIKIFSAPTKVVRATATAYNPEFLVPNTIRDSQSAFVNAGMNPLRFVEGLYHLARKDDVYQQFLQAGGRTSRVRLDRKFLADNVDDMATGGGLKVSKPGDILKIMQKMGDYSEQPTRIGLFQKELDKQLAAGVPRNEALTRAAYMAQEGTVNFARSGSKTQSVNALVAFFNARLQGADRLARSIKNDPVGASFRIGLITQVPAVIAYLWNRNFDSYFDDRIVSQSDRDNNYILMLSDKPIEKLRGAQFLKIPKGDVGRFANPTEEALGFLDGRDDSDETFKKLGEAFLSLSPLDNFGDIIPSGIKPWVENAANYNFFAKQDIVPEYKKNYPAKDQYSSYTAPTYKLAGKVLNVSPAKLQNVVSGYGTGIEKIATMVTDPIASAIDPGVAPEKNLGSAEVNRTPMMRRFLGGAKRSLTEQYMSDLSRLRSLNIQIQDIQNAVKRGDVGIDEGQAKVQELITEMSKISKELQSPTYNDVQQGAVIPPTVTTQKTGGVTKSKSRGGVSRGKSATLKTPRGRRPVEGAPLDVSGAIDLSGLLEGIPELEEYYQMLLKGRPKIT